MRFEVKTCNNVRVLIDSAKVKVQRKVTIQERSYYQIVMQDGTTLDLNCMVPSIPLENEVVISSKFMERVVNKYTTTEASK